MNTDLEITSNGDDSAGNSANQAKIPPSNRDPNSSSIVNVRSLTAEQKTQQQNFKTQKSCADSFVTSSLCSFIEKLLVSTGALLTLFFVAFPKDVWRWLTRPRKCVRGQTVLITGGASGLGRRLAEIFAYEEGARVAIIDNNGKGAAEVADSIQQAVKAATSQDGDAPHSGVVVARAWQCDIADAAAMTRCANEIRAEFGEIDIVVCNAAVLHFALCMDLTDEQLRQGLEVNVLGTLNTIRAFSGPMMAANRGHIVAIASIAGFFGETFGLAYCPTKFAVRGAMDCIRMELRDRSLDGMACTTICPFFVRTPMVVNKGIRPWSRWIPFMSINRCAEKIADAILRERTIAFMPGWTWLMTVIFPLLSDNMQRVARDWIGFRYYHSLSSTFITSTFSSPSCTDSDSSSDSSRITHPSNGLSLPSLPPSSSSSSTPSSSSSPSSSTSSSFVVPSPGSTFLAPASTGSSEQQLTAAAFAVANGEHLLQMRGDNPDSIHVDGPQKRTKKLVLPFRRAGLVWYALIPAAMLLTFVVWARPDSLLSLARQIDSLSSGQHSNHAHPQQPQQHSVLSPTIPAPCCFSVTAFLLPLVHFIVVPVEFVAHLGIHFPNLLLAINIAAWLAHFGEAILALWLCDSKSIAKNSTAKTAHLIIALQWFAQTLLLGYPSLRLLLSLLVHSHTTNQ